VSNAKDEQVSETPEVPEEETTEPETQPAQPSEPETPTEDPQPDEGPDGTPDEETRDGDEPEAPDEPEQTASTNPSVEKQQAMFDSAVKKASRYVGSVIDTLGDSARDLSPCPRCADFLPGFVLPHGVKPVTPEQRVAVRVSMGDDAEPEYILDRDAATCARCGGWGKVLTGSHVRNQDKATCPGCHGRGFTGPLATTATLPVADALPVAANGEVVADEPTPDTDPWGRMKGDPNYGVLPGFTS
jgi:Periplasmic protein TonB, links inner and outer membranes